VAVPAPPPPAPRRRRFSLPAGRHLHGPVLAPGGSDRSSAPASARLFVILGSSIAGIGIATYLTLVHYTTAVTLVCSNGGPVNCETVLASPESYLLGIPVAVLGLVYFVVVLVSALPALWRSPNPLVAPARLALAVGGIGFVCYLVYAELYEIGKICLWCTGVHILTFVIFVAVVTGWDEMTSFARGQTAGN
jgi:uncharacterized membrane protein